MTGVIGEKGGLVGDSEPSCATVWSTLLPVAGLPVGIVNAGIVVNGVPDVLLR